MNRTFIKLLLLSLLLMFVMPNTITASDEPFHFGFKKSKNGKPASIDQEGFKSILEKNDALFLGDSSEKNLYLTFDNGYENGYTSKILDVLKDKNVPAAFFVTGQYIKEEPELLRRMVNEGHIIANHSWSHPDMTTLSDDEITKQLDRVKLEVEKVTGQKDMLFLRPPRGIFSDRTLQVSRSQNYINVFWSAAYVDWITDKQRGWQHAYDKITAQLHPGAIILLHSVSKDNAEAMSKIIDKAREDGYEFKSLNTLVYPDF
jgi:peptidoglycan-N-acetylmuramic acid deacetylase